MRSLGWECPRCGRVYAPWVYSCTCQPQSNTRWPPGRYDMSSCPCLKENGGSGICGCVLYPTVTCSVEAAS